LKHIDWDAIESINDLRMSCGFLPIHLSPFDGRAWIAIYKTLKFRFPDLDLLMDDSNTEGWIPLHAVLGSRETGNIQNELLSVMQFILRDCPRAALHKPRMPVQLLLVSSTVDCFCQFLLDGQYDVRAETLINRIFAGQIPDWSSKGYCTLAELGFNAESEKQFGLWLFTCCAYAFEIFERVVPQHTSTARAICLQTLLMVPTFPHSYEGISKIVALGFDSVLPADVDPVLASHPLWHYTASHWDPPTYDEIEECLAGNDEFDRDTTKPFWQTFWQLVTAYEASPPSLTSDVEFLPAPEELVIFSEPTDVLHFMEWGKKVCPTYTNILQMVITHFVEQDNTRETETGKKNRFKEYAEHANLKTE
jgi:hypothetical protein